MPSHHTPKHAGTERPSLHTPERAVTERCLHNKCGNSDVPYVEPSLHKPKQAGTGPAFTRRSKRQPARAKPSLAEVRGASLTITRSSEQVPAFLTLMNLAFTRRSKREPGRPSLTEVSGNLFRLNVAITRRSKRKPP